MRDLPVGAICVVVVGLVLSVGLGTWVFLNSGANAKQALSIACEQTADHENFDLISRLTASDRGGPLETLIFNIEVSGDNFKGTIEQQGVPGIDDFIGIGDTTYHRVRGEGWGEIETFNLASVFILVDSRPRYTGAPWGDFLCTSELMSEGASVVHKSTQDGIRHFQVEKVLGTDYVTSDGSEARAIWDYWVNADDVLTKTKHVFMYGPLPEDAVTIATEILRVGEPNVITAPVVQ